MAKKTTASRARRTKQGASNSQTAEREQPAIFILPDPLPTTAKGLRAAVHDFVAYQYASGRPLGTLAAMSIHTAASLCTCKAELLARIEQVLDARRPSGNGAERHLPAFEKAERELLAIFGADGQRVLERLQPTAQPQPQQPQPTNGMLFDL